MISILAETATRGPGYFYLMVGLLFLAAIYNHFAD